MLDRWNKAHVPLWKIISIEFGYGAKYRDITELFNVVPYLVLMTFPSDLIEDYSHDIDMGIKMDTAHEQSCHGAGAFGAIQNNENREVQ